MKYKQLTTVTNTQFADVVSLFMIEAGSEGTSVTDVNDVKELLANTGFWDYYDPSLLTEDARVFVRGFFRETDDLTSLIERIQALGAAAGSLETDTCLLDSSDYENEWRKYYHPIEIGRVAIVPKWHTYDGNAVQVRLDPGMAFGTGSHETTAMCVQLMQAFDLRGKTVYDVGCGSGILGITAWKLGAGKVIMADIDENAVTAARENASLNGATCEILHGDMFAGKTEPADVVLANITADVLLKMKNLLKPLLKPCGVLIISGIINARAEEIGNAFGALFDPVRSIRKGEWQAFAYRAR